MFLLLYCIADASGASQIAAKGVNGVAVETMERANLRCYLSRMAVAISEKQASTPDAALAFHRVLQEIFRQRAIIPFRFPTTVEDDAELLSFLDEHGAEYRESLNRLRDMVQMEIRVTTRHAVSPGGVKPSGTDYLRAKQMRDQQVGEGVTAVRNATAGATAAWRERHSAQGKRGFALVRREQVRQFEAALQAIEVAPELQVRVSGPWPATEFLKSENA